MKAIYHIFFCFVFLCPAYILQAQCDSNVRYVKTPTGYLMVLKQGDNVFSQLKIFAKKENIPSASFTAIGFAEIEFGFFNRRTKQYRPKKFKAGEVGSMHGSIAWQNGDISIHSHGLLCDKKFRAHGGHILSATVGTGTLEITIVVHDQKLDRKYNAALGANELSLSNCGN